MFGGTIIKSLKKILDQMERCREEKYRKIQEGYNIGYNIR